MSGDVCPNFYKSSAHAHSVWRWWRANIIKAIWHDDHLWGNFLWMANVPRRRRPRGDRLRWGCVCVCGGQWQCMTNSCGKQMSAKISRWIVSGTRKTSLASGSPDASFRTMNWICWQGLTWIVRSPLLYSWREGKLIHWASSAEVFYFLSSPRR